MGPEQLTTVAPEVLDGRISVLIVGSQVLFGSGLGRLLEDDDRLQVAGVREWSDDVPDACRGLAVDVVVLDPDLAPSPVAGRVRMVKEMSPRTKVVVISDAGEWSVIPALHAGADGILSKTTDPETVRCALIAVHSGCQVLSRDAMTWMLEKGSGHNLTRRETDVLRLMVTGAGNREIAQALRLGDKTVRNYVSRLYRKVDLSSMMPRGATGEIVVSEAVSELGGQS